MLMGIEQCNNFCRKKVVVKVECGQFGSFLLCWCITPRRTIMRINPEFEMTQ